MMLEPYYQQDDITIYLGDCRDILPTFPDKSFDLVLTDPPYGIGYIHSGKGSAPFGRKRPIPRKTERIIGDNSQFDPTFLFEHGKEVFVWGANNFCHLLPVSVGRWMVWDKADGRYDVDSFGDIEIGWHSVGRAGRLYRYAWKGVYCMKSGENNGKRLHPTMKPLSLMRWCIKQSNSTGDILDPFMGSGTTLVAAKQLGRKAVGIEIEEKYVDIAIKRLAQMELFSPVSEGR